MMRAGGYAVWAGGDGAAIEHDTATCAHCNRVVMLAPRQPPPGHCLRCDKGLCAACAASGRCVPFERRLEAMERRGALLRAVLG